MDIDALAQRAVDDWAAQQKPDELAEFARLIIGSGYRTLLEVGTYSGGTARFFAAVGLEVDAIDRYLGNLHPDAISSGVRFHEADSHTAPCDWRWDVVLIDGDHSLAGVTADWERFAPCAAGMVAFHDIVTHDPPTLCEVGVFWRAVAGFRTCEIVSRRDRSPSAGIGIVFVGPLTARGEAPDTPTEER